MRGLRWVVVGVGAGLAAACMLSFDESEVKVGTGGSAGSDASTGGAAGISGGSGGRQCGRRR